MKARLVCFLKYYLFWIVFFVVQKPVFMLWQYRLLGEVGWMDWVLVPVHGFPLDLSVASYITAVMGVMLCVSCWVRWNIVRRLMDILTYVLLFVALWTMLGDNGCFPSWGYHLNKDIFSYLASPKEALACAPWWVWGLGTLAFVVLFIAWGWGYLWWMKSSNEQIANDELAKGWTKGLQTCGLLLLTGVLFLPIRGSVTVSTMNTGRVYFSDNRMLNIAAINPVFNIIESLSEDHFSADRYRYMSEEEAEKEVKTLFQSAREDTMSDRIFTTQRPNIVLCILESFSWNAMQAGAMPQLTKLAKEGIFFSNTYAASHRTDRGVMAVLGAFPGSAMSSVMVVPEKSGQLPQIGQVLKQEGYHLKFFYGGDEDFTNMRSYLITGGFEDRVADRDFPIADKMSKWGVPDHILFRRAAQEIKLHADVQSPSFDVVLSLSSHEPFEVPYHHVEDPYLNAIAYTDSCLGAFVDTLRSSTRWGSTIVVMVADHGYPYPNDIQSYEPAHYHIPMVIMGGAVNGAREITTCCQQVDWVPTVLHQMGLSAEQFMYAKDVLDTSIQSFAYYNFVDGFAMMTDTSSVVFDAASNQVLMGADTTLLRRAQALTQHIMQTINKL